MQPCTCISSQCKWSLLLWSAFVIVDQLPGIVNHSCRYGDTGHHCEDTIFITSSLFCYFWIPEIVWWSQLISSIIKSGIVSTCGIRLLTRWQKQEDQQRSRIKLLEEEGRRLRQIAEAVNAGLHRPHQQQQEHVVEDLEQQ